MMVRTFMSSWNDHSLVRTCKHITSNRTLNYINRTPSYINRTIILIGHLVILIGHLVISTGQLY